MPTGTPLIRIANISENKIDLSSCVYIQEKVDDRFTISYGDLLIAMSGATTGKMGVYLHKDKALLNQRVGNLKIINLDSLLPEYRNYFMQSKVNEILKRAYGGAQPNISSSNICDIDFLLPPLKEQHRIVEKVKYWFALIDIIESGKDDLQETIKQAKSKILDLAIHGKLVSQEPNDEPATELLKRINPKAEITCDTPHYRNQPKGWAVCRLEDIVEYEQPTAYIVSSTDYDDSYPTPVLTAGKSFLIGHTNDEEGIFSNLPCIIFDDFTTDSKLVNFPFKVKSSAMKILKVHKNVDIEYVASFMSITRLIGDTHKRYWISEYSKLEIPLPPYKEQVRIKNQIKLLFERLDSITECL